MSEQRTDFPNVYRWMRGVFARPPVPTKIELRHISEGRNTETQAQINAWEGKDELGKPADEIAAEVIREATEDAKNHPRGYRQTYAILAYRNTEEVYQARCIFSVKGRGNNFDTDDVIQESEPANEKGLTALAMREMSRAIDRVQQMSHQQATFMDRELERKRREVDELQKLRFAMYAMMENMMDRSQERELNLRKEARFENVKDLGVKKLEQLFPIVMGKLVPSMLTANGSPELKKLGQETGIQMTIGTFFESLNKAQLSKILDILSKDQAVIFIELNSKRNAQVAFEFFAVMDKERVDKILSDILDDNQRVLFMQSVKDIETFIKAQNEKAEREEEQKKRNGVDTNEPS